MKISTAILFAAILALTAGACSSRKTAVTAPRVESSPRARATGNVSADPNSAPGIAQREVIRRQEMIRQMDEAALRASQRMAEDDLEGAVDGYRRALGQ